MAAKTSNKNPEKLFAFKLTSAIELTHFGMGLSLCDFGMGRVDKGFKITVRNSDNKAAGYLFFKSFRLINFHCSKPIIGKLISVTQIYLDATKDDNTINVFHLDGSNKLTLSLGSDPDTKYNVELLEMEVKVERIPEFTFFCVATVTSEILSELIDRLEEPGMAPLVSLSIAETIGEYAWYSNYEELKVVRLKGRCDRKKKYAKMAIDVHVHGPCHHNTIIIIDRVNATNQQRAPSSDPMNQEPGSNQNNDQEQSSSNGVQQPEEELHHVEVFLDNNGFGFINVHNLQLVGVLEISHCPSWHEFMIMIRNVNPNPNANLVMPNPGNVWPGRFAVFDSIDQAGAFHFIDTPWEIVRIQCTRVRLVPDDDDDDDEEEEDDEGGDGDDHSVISNC